MNTCYGKGIWKLSLKSNESAKLDEQENIFVIFWQKLIATLGSSNDSTFQALWHYGNLFG